MHLGGKFVLLSLCVALAGTVGATALEAHLADDKDVRHCRNLGFSERLRVRRSRCREARVVARRAVRHIASDESGWQIDAQVRGLRGRTWDCAGRGFNPLPLTCRSDRRWIKLQIWAD